MEPEAGQRIRPAVSEVNARERRVAHVWAAPRVAAPACQARPAVRASLPIWEDLTQY